MEKLEATKSLQELRPIKSNNNQSMYELFKGKLCNSFAQAIIAFIETRNKILKIFILTFVIVSSGLAAYLVIEGILTYFTYSVLTSTRTLFETPTLFPKITICNQNPFITNYATEFIRNRSLIIPPKMNIFDLNYLLNLNYSEKVKLFEKVGSASMQIISSSISSNDKKLKISHSFDDILAYCRFNSKNFFL